MSDQGDPGDYAVALRYDGVNAPRVTAKGAGELARRIRDIAAAHGIPLHQDPLLTALLSQVELDEEIPPGLYLAVAQVIAFAYLIAGKTPQAPENHPAPVEGPSHENE
jgi:flagellar biosynthesis protein